MNSPLPHPPIPLRVTQASLNQTAFNFPRNVTNILAAIDGAVAQGSDLLCLEELTLTGYDAGDDFQKTDNRITAELLRYIAAYAHQKSPDLVISIGHPWYYADKSAGYDGGIGDERHNDALYNRLNLPFNVQSFLGQGRILAMTAKSYLFGYERGYEKRYFNEWSSSSANRVGGRFGTIEIQVPGQSEAVPFGRPILHMQTGHGAINLTHIICEEKWIASRYNQPHGTDVDYGKDSVASAIAGYVGRQGLVFVVPNASPPSSLKVGKHVHLASLASQYAEAVIDTDGLGSSGSTFAQFGYRLLVQDGKVVSYGSRLNFGRVATTTSTIAVNAASPETEARAHISVPHELQAVGQTPHAELAYQRSGKTWDDPQNLHRKVEETVRMTALWLFDYMRKTGSQGIAEALSGGADSAFNTAMVSIMVRLAVADLGVEGFCREMRHLRYKDKILQAAQEKGEEAAIQVCLGHMLTSVYMGTNNSSDATRNAARFLVKGGELDGATVTGTGGKFMERNVQDLLDFYAVVYAVENTSQIIPERKIALQTELATYLNIRPGSVTSQQLSEKAEDIRRRYPEIEGDIISAADPRHAIAYENIQARARQVLIMLIANAEGKMAIANPNLDEGRNAYATFGGDLHSGTINLNGFLPKAMQLQIMDHLFKHGLEGMDPIKGLAFILKNKPSAELQPKDEQGHVVQNDEDALQRNFEQMNRIAELMLRERTGKYHERRLNPAEVYAACQQDQCFSGVDIVSLYNMVSFSYHRWGIAQHKIHASPITPTFGENIDHQVSLRTPNLNGQDHAELTQLGIKILFGMAKQEFGEHASAAWSCDAEKAWMKRALVDEEFVEQFYSEVRAAQESKLEYDIGRLYQRVRTQGLSYVFKCKPLNLV